MGQGAPGIEFLDPDDPGPRRPGATGDLEARGLPFDRQPDDPNADLRAPATPDPALVGTLGMLAAATALCLVAAFQTLFTLRLGGPEGLAPGAYRVDGWGRYQALGPVFFLSPGHFTRYGIPVTVCGGAFAVLTAVVAVVALRARGSARPSPRGLPFVTGWGIAVTAALGGTFAAAVLQVEGLGDATKDLLTRQGVPAGFRTEVVLHFGPFCYLVLAAMLAGVLAIVSSRRLARYWSPATAPPYPVPVVPVGPARRPVPVDDGAADHLPGRVAPSVRLPATDGTTVALDDLPAGRTIVFVYPRTGRPDAPVPPGWYEIAGAAGSTAEAIDFREHTDALAAAGIAAVYGLSSQSSDYQREVVERLGLPFALLSDPELVVAGALFLPTFTADGRRWFHRLTLVLREGAVEHAFYPVFPPERHAQQVLDWLVTHPQRPDGSG